MMLARWSLGFCDEVFESDTTDEREIACATSRVEGDVQAERDVRVVSLIN